MVNPTLFDLPPELYSTLSTHLDLSSLISLSQSSSSTRSLVLHDFLPSHIRSKARSPISDPDRIVAQAKWIDSIDRHYGANRMSALVFPFSSKSSIAPNQSRRRLLTTTTTTNTNTNKSLPMPNFTRFTSSSNANTYLIISSGLRLEAWSIGTDSQRVDPFRIPLIYDDTLPFSNIHDEIVSIESIHEEEGSDILVVRMSGTIQRLRLLPSETVERGLRCREIARYHPLSGDNRTTNKSTSIHSVSTIDDKMIVASTFRPKPSLRRPVPKDPTLNSDTRSDQRIDLTTAANLTREHARSTTFHQLSLHMLNSPWTAPTILKMSTKPWSSLILSNSIIIGSTGLSPLSITPLSTFSSNSKLRILGGELEKSSSIYGLCKAVQGSSGMNPDQTLIVAYYDSITRIYDLRSPSFSSSSFHSISNTRSNSQSNLIHDRQHSKKGCQSVIELTDPWNDDPNYSVASGGIEGSMIAVGNGRNSSIRLFDVRNCREVLNRFNSDDFGAGQCFNTEEEGGRFVFNESEPGASTGARTNSAIFTSNQIQQEQRNKKGVTLFSPTRDRSPIYRIEFEFARLYACTDTNVIGIDWDRVGPTNSRRRHSGSGFNRGSFANDARNDGFDTQGRGLGREAVAYYEFGGNDARSSSSRNGELRRSW